MSPSGQLTGSSQAALFLPAAVLPENRFIEGENLHLNRLYSRADRAVTSSRTELKRIFAEHGLDRQKLMRTQQAIDAQSKTGSSPTPTEFWESTALPQSERLRSAAMNQLRLCQDELAAALEQLSHSLRQWPIAGVADETVSGSQSFHDHDLHRRSLHCALRQVAIRFRTVLPDSQIDELGRWWQARLYRSALAATLPKSILSSMSELAASARDFEMELLDQPPWSHGDRLLLAFETTHRELRQAITSVEHDLAFGVMSLSAGQ